MTTGDYCTLPEIKARLWPDSAIPDNLKDKELSNLITAASRGIDEHTGTRFFTTSADEIRYFTPIFTDRIWAGPLLSITSIYTDDDGDRVYETLWAASDWELYPWNSSLDSKPYSEIRTTPNGSYSFPRAARSTKITGKFGWSASTPALIKEACILSIVRLHERPSAPFGTLGPSGFGQAGSLPVEDPDVKRILRAFRVNLI